MKHFPSAALMDTIADLIQHYGFESVVEALKEQEAAHAASSTGS